MPVPSIADIAGAFARSAAPTGTLFRADHAPGPGHAGQAKHRVCDQPRAGHSRCTARTRSAGRRRADRLDRPRYRQRRCGNSYSFLSLRGQLRVRQHSHGRRWIGQRPYRRGRHLHGNYPWCLQRHDAGVLHRGIRRLGVNSVSNKTGTIGGRAGSNLPGSCRRFSAEYQVRDLPYLAFR